MGIQDDIREDERRQRAYDRMEKMSEAQLRRMRLAQYDAVLKRAVIEKLRGLAELADDMSQNDMGWLTPRLARKFHKATALLNEIRDAMSAAES